MRGRGLLRTDFASIIGFGLATQMLTLLSGPLVARMLGPEGRGELVLVLTISALVSHVSIAALARAISAVVARHGRGGRELLGHHVRWWQGWCLVPAVAAAVWIFTALESSDQRTSLAALAFVTTFAGCFLNVLGAMALGEHRVKIVNGSVVAYSAVYVGGVVLLFLMVGKAEPPIILLCTIVGQLVAITMVRAALKPGVPGRVGPEVRREVHRFTRLSYLSALGTSDRLGLDSLLVGYLLGTASLGIYAVALSVATLPSVILAAVATALLPRMTARDPVDAAALLRRWLLASAALDLALVAALQLVLDPAIRIFFGEAFIPSIAISRVLMITQAFVGIRLMMSVAVQAQGRAAAASYVDLCCGAILVVAVIVGAHTHGLMGAAVGMTVAAAANCAALAVLTSWSGRGVRVRPVRDG